MPPKRKGPTAYFLFSEEHREAVHQELLQKQQEQQQGEGGGSSKLSVAVVAKALGEKWRALSDEDKARYKEAAQRRAAELAAQGGCLESRQLLDS